MLADEPTGNLDPDLSLEIMNLFREINARGTTVVVATHDRELIRRVGRRAVTLDHGHIVEVDLMRALRYFFIEAAASLWRGRSAAVLAMLTIAVGLFVLGLFLALNANLQRLVGRWTESAELSVYLKDDASADQLRTIDAAGWRQRRRRAPRVCVEGAGGRAIPAGLSRPGRAGTAARAQPVSGVD